VHLKLPELGEGVHEGELLKWKVKVGDVVKDDQVLCEIMTDKATVELPAPFRGKITELLAKEGEVVKVGQEMLSYEDGGKAAAAGNGKEKAAPAPAPAHASAPAAAKPASGPAPAAMAPAPSGGGALVAAAPSTRKFARESGVDLSRVPASGPGGRVMREDVERFIGGGGPGGGGATAAGAPTLARSVPSRPLAPSGGEERVPFRGLRKKIAEKMRLSKDKAAHFTYAEEADASELVNLRNHAKELGARQGIKVTYLPFLMKAMVAALKRYPTLNSTLDEEKGELVIKHYYNIGLSVQTEDGLTAPVIKNVDQKTILELAAEIQNVVDRARARKLTMEDLTGGTITLTNAGSIGGLFATPVINFPEVAILGFNKIAKKPVYKDGQIVVRDWTIFSISLDHRVVDGAVGAEFMKQFIQYVETPSLLLLEGS
jgi:pyruvate dehydrogenase E2 component (dihydrolipoamide acetyltransferase)